MLQIGKYKTYKNYEATVKYIDTQVEIAYGTVMLEDMDYAVMWCMKTGQELEWVFSRYSINMELGQQ